MPKVFSIFQFGRKSTLAKLKVSWLQTWCVQHTTWILYMVTKTLWSMDLQQSHPWSVWGPRSRCFLPVYLGSLHICSLHCRPAMPRDTGGGLWTTSSGHTWQQSEAGWEAPRFADLRDMKPKWSSRFRGWLYSSLKLREMGLWPEGRRFESRDQLRKSGWGKWVRNTLPSFQNHCQGALEQGTLTKSVPVELLSSQQ